jgi:hypothetical protein
MSEPLTATNEVDAKERPFPWRCPRCREKAVRREKLAYQCKRTHGEAVVTLSIPDLEVPKCGNCGELVFDYVAEEQINQAYRKLAITEKNGSTGSKNAAES